MRRFLLIVMGILAAACWIMPALGGMASEHYRISTTVISGSGGNTVSNNYESQATLGQPSPLMDPVDPPYSNTYDLYPGFWYTLAAEMDCSDLASFVNAFGRLIGETGYSAVCDKEPDGDVDGEDLAEYATGF